ncbi:hypothetical protein D6764_00900 [Candidatus Woesearchaeota archaeon]|nr:MAG: hypothetical protein D6764_00900 [Candidatus Woesearchaeota archaeon]
MKLQGVVMVEFQIKKKEKQGGRHYPKTVLDIAYEYGKKAYKEFGQLIKGMVLFGSATRELDRLDAQSTPGMGTGDIDILVILDDLTIQLTPDVLEAYKIISEKLVASTDKRLHITTLKFTTFWELIRNGDPVGINILREGHAIIDTGFFDPLQALLAQGRILPTSEAVHAYFAKAPRALHSARMHLLQGAVDMYWAVIDATQSAIMRVGEMPPNPKNAAEVVREKLIKPGFLPKKFSRTVDKFYKLAKGIIHREIKDVKGDDYHEYLREAQEYVDAVRKFLDDYPRKHAKKQKKE